MKLPGFRNDGIVCYANLVHYIKCYAAKRRRKSKNVGEYKQQDNTESAQYISNKQVSKYSNVGYKQQFTGSETS